MYVDLVASALDGRKVVIENQFGPPDHRHLGQCVMYYRTLGADDAIWIVEEEKPNFVNVVNGLNTENNFNIYLAVLRFRQVEGNPILYPDLKVAAGPPVFMGLDKDTARDEFIRNQKQRALAVLMCEEAAKSPALELRRPESHHYYLTAPTGHPGITCEIGMTQENTTVSLWFARTTRWRADAIFDQLAKKRRRNEIEEAFGEPLEWKREVSARGHKVTATINAGGWDSSDEWQDTNRHLWLRTTKTTIKKASKLIRIFQPHLDKAVDNATRTGPPPQAA